MFRRFTALILAFCVLAFFGSVPLISVAEDAPKCKCAGNVNGECKCGPDCKCEHCAAKADGKGCQCGPDCKCEHCKTGKGNCTCKAGDGKGCHCGKGCGCEHCKTGKGKCACKAGDGKGCHCGKGCGCEHCKTGKGECACKAGDGKGCHCGKGCKCEHCKTGKGKCACKAGDAKGCQCGPDCKCEHCKTGKGKCACKAGDAKGCQCGPDCKCEHCKTGKGECTCKAGKGCNCKKDGTDCSCGKDCKCGHCKDRKCGCHAGKNGHDHGSSSPADADLSTSKESAARTFKASYTTDPAAVPVNKIHTWTLKIETADGKPVTDAEIAVSGDMPEHGHGLPTQPKMTKNLGNGSYLIEGVKFSMPGFWVMTFTVKSGGKEDKVVYNLNLK